MDNPPSPNDLAPRNDSFLSLSSRSATQPNANDRSHDDISDTMSDFNPQKDASLHREPHSLHLMSFPRALRDGIYEYATAGIRITHTPSTGPLPMLLICCQMQEEVVPVMLKHSLFVVRQPEQLLEDAVWPKGVFDQAEVRHLEVRSSEDIHPPETTMSTSEMLSWSFRCCERLQNIVASMPQLQSFHLRDTLDLLSSELDMA